MLHIHLVEFFRFYGHTLNSREIGISIRSGGFLFFKGDPNLCKEGKPDCRLQVESPISPIEDVGASARNFN